MSLLSKIKAFSLIFFISLFMNLGLQAQTQTSPPTPKAKLNTQIYEKESTSESFTEKVNVVRELQDEVEVFFDGNKKGPYVLPEGPNHGLYFNRLEKSKKAAGPKVKVVIDNDRIQSVEIVEQKEPTSAGPSEADILKSIYKDQR